jgi:hypothetical protein
LQKQLNIGITAPLAKCPKNNKAFKELVSQLDDLLLIVGNDEKHHLMGLV